MCATCAAPRLLAMRKPLSGQHKDFQLVGIIERAEILSIGTVHQNQHVGQIGFGKTDRLQPFRGSMYWMSRLCRPITERTLTGGAARISVQLRISNITTAMSVTKAS